MRWYSCPMPISGACSPGNRRCAVRYAAMACRWVAEGWGWGWGEGRAGVRGWAGVAAGRWAQERASRACTPQNALLRSLAVPPPSPSQPDRSRPAWQTRGRRPPRRGRTPGPGPSPCQGSGGPGQGGGRGARVGRCRVEGAWVCQPATCMHKERMGTPPQPACGPRRAAAHRAAHSTLRFAPAQTAACTCSSSPRQTRIRRGRGALPPACSRRAGRRRSTERTQGGRPRGARVQPHGKPFTTARRSLCPRRRPSLVFPHTTQLPCSAAKGDGWVPPSLVPTREQLVLLLELKRGGKVRRQALGGVRVSLQGRRGERVTLGVRAPAGGRAGGRVEGGWWRQSQHPACVAAGARPPAHHKWVTCHPTCICSRRHEPNIPVCGVADRTCGTATLPCRQSRPSCRASPSRAQAGGPPTHPRRRRRQQSSWETPATGLPLPLAAGSAPWAAEDGGEAASSASGGRRAVGRWGCRRVGGNSGAPPAAGSSRAAAGWKGGAGDAEAEAGRVLQG